MPRKRARGLVDVFEEQEDLEEVTTPTRKQDKDHVEPEPAPMGFAVPDGDLDQESQETDRGEVNRSTQTRVSKPTKFVHSQTVSGNEASSSEYDPSESPVLVTLRGCLCTFQ
jgi:hypothetical protein